MKNFLSVLLSVSMAINFVNMRVSFAVSESVAEDRALERREGILEHSKQSEVKIEEETQKHSEENLQSLSTKSDVAKKDKSKKWSLTLKSAFKWIAALLAGGFAAAVSFVLGKRNSRTEFESLRENKIEGDLNTCREVCDAESYEQGLNSAKQQCGVEKAGLERLHNTNLKNAEAKANSRYNDGYAEGYLVGTEEFCPVFEVCDAESYEQGLNSAKQQCGVEKDELERLHNTNLQDAEAKCGERANSRYDDGYTEGYLVGTEEFCPVFEVCDAESYKQGLNSAKQLFEVEKNELEQQLNTNLKNAEAKANSRYNDGYAEGYLVGKKEAFTFFDNKGPDFLPVLLECVLSFTQSKSIGANCLENVVDSVDLQSVYEFYNAISDKLYDY